MDGELGLHSRLKPHTRLLMRRLPVHHVSRKPTPRVSLCGGFLWNPVAERSGMLLLFL